VTSSKSQLLENAAAIFGGNTIAADGADPLLRILQFSPLA
jgi:hypothetical protein